MAKLPNFDTVYQQIKELYYITHLDNLESIFQHGILSHNDAINLNKHSVYDDTVVNIRKNKELNGKSLWGYSNLYFQVRNPMLYAVKGRFSDQNIVVLSIDKSILQNFSSYVTDGNAASYSTQFHPVRDLPKISKLLKENRKLEYWSPQDDSKRSIMCEYLSPDPVAPHRINGVYVANQEVFEKVKNLCSKMSLTPTINPNLFFNYTYHNKIFNNVHLFKGDMFFSKAQTLTISVNCVGVMGKGQAARAKYQFPHVYVKYEDICKKKKLTLGKPILLQENYPMDELMSDQDLKSEHLNNLKWFLLFPAKGDWREKSRLDMIEEGLKHLVKMQEKWQMKTLALPALGCGLGGLPWDQVGPIMCKYADQLKIPVAIYLPIEKSIHQESLTPEFLSKLI